MSPVSFQAERVNVRLSSRRTLTSLALLLMVVASPAGATTFSVDTTVDLPDGNIADGICSWMAEPDFNVPTCSLRAAVMQANVTPVDPDAPVVSIQLLPGESYFLAGGANEKEIVGATGDLDISRPMEIGVNPMFSAATVSMPDAAERLFDIHPGAEGTRLVGMTLETSGGGGAGCVIRSQEDAGLLSLDHLEVRDAACALGMIALFDGPTSIKDSEIHHGTRALWASGAIFTVERSTFHSNTDLPTVVLLNASHGMFVNSTFSGNFKPLTARSSNLIVLASTFVDSTEEHIAFKTDNAAQVFRVSNALMAGTGASSCLYYDTNDAPVDIAGTVDVSGSVFDDESCIPNGNAPAAANLYGATVALSPLGNYGGPTSTHEQLEGSESIDFVPASFCPNGSDQRGFERSVSYYGEEPARCDAGATELPVDGPILADHIFGDGFEDD